MVKKEKKKRFSIIEFLAGVKKELPKIKWTSKKELLKYSIAVVLFILFIVLFFLMLDLMVALLEYIKELIS